MIYPYIGQTIDSAYAIELCQHFNLHYLSDRLENNPTIYKSWRFDGVSGISDKLVNLLLLRTDDQITYTCALPHDLAYAYGTLNDHQERKIVDSIFLKNVMGCGVSKPIAYCMYFIVRILGSETVNSSFSWGYANNYRYKKKI